jgi:hypothetical protein
MEEREGVLEVGKCKTIYKCKDLKARIESIETSRV